MPIQQNIPQSPQKRNGWKWLIFIVLIILLIGGGMYSFVRIKHIKAGYIGIKSSLSNPVDNTSDLDISILNVGYAVYMPMNSDITIYPTTVQTSYYDKMTLLTNDGVEFTIKPHISYQLDENNIHLFYKSHKGNFDQLNKGYLKEIIDGSYSAAALNFESDSLIHNMNNFEADVSKLLSAKMADIGLVLKNTNLNFEIPQKIKDLVEERSLAKQNTLLTQDKFAQTYAEANLQRVKDSLLNSSLTNLAIQKMFIEKWDGRLSIPANEFKIYRDINRDEADERKEK